MLRPYAKPLATRLRLGWLITGLLLTIGLLVGVFWWPRNTSAATPLFAPDPVTAAWEKARAAGSYHFTSNVKQVTVPSATIANVGRTSRSEELYLEGKNDLPNKTLEMTLWGNGGNVQQAESGLSLRVEQGKSYTRRPGQDWEEIENMSELFAPQGDFLAYLAALKEVTAAPAQERNGLRFTPYHFTIDSPKFARYIHQQLESTMRAKGELPPGLNLQVPTYFSEMIGTGELWIGEDGLPLRQILNLQFPEQHDEAVRAQITVDFSNFGKTTPAGGWAMLQAGHYAGIWTVLTQALPNPVLLFALPLMVGLAIVVLRYRRVRMIQTALAIAVISGQIITPVLSSFTTVRFVDTQRAKAATQEEIQADRRAQLDLRDALTTSEFNPQVNPLASQPLEQERPVEAPSGEVFQAPAQLTVDSPTDTDGDTLRDFVEERINTSTVISDTDGDGLNDNIEVNGFSFGNQSWYLDPNAVDSNGDGQGDALEWGFNSNGTLRPTPQDNDNDNLPDLFDPDNDNDGVPDNKDLAPFAKGATAFSEAAPLQLTLNDLSPNKPTFVEFQLRPQNEQQLWYAFNVLDWPTDSMGQVQDIDGTSFADVATSQGRTPTALDSHGDMKILPMLEIRVPDSGANLPPQSDLTPFNISVNNYTNDGQTKVVYVPLNLVNDERTGQRVAFSGKMRYLPTGVWNNANQVRLVWLVQALVDQGTTKCDATATPPITTNCTADGYLHNVPQTIQSYYTDWTLTGLTVREEHGTTMLSVYEDPALDSNTKDDSALTALSFVLDQHFALSRPDRLTINEVSKRFDYGLNSGYTDDQRFNVPRITRVVSQTYSTLDQAVASTAMTETVKILNDKFSSAVNADRAIKPLLFFAQESRNRLVGLDSAITSEGYVTQNGAALTIDMAPSGQPAATVDTTAGIKWAAYCPPATGPISWQPCTIDEYWDVLEQRYANLAPLPEDGTDTGLVGGRLMLTQLYYTGLATGFYSTVQQGNQLFSGLYSLSTENQTAGLVRDTLRGLSTVPLLAGVSFNRVIDPLFGKGVFGVTLLDKFTKWGGNLRGQLAQARTGELTGGTVAPGSAKAALTKVRLVQYGITRFYGGLAGAAGAVLMVIFQITALSPSVDLTTRRVLGALAVTLSLGVNVVLPVVQTTLGLQGAAGGISKVSQILSGAAKVANSIKIAGAVGLVISVAITWGFFIYAAATSGLAAGSPQLNKLAVETIASTVVTVLLFVLAANPIGLIIAGIVAFIDLLLTLICELGVDELRIQGSFYGGACFTLSTSVVKVLSYFLYNYDLMVNMNRNDLVVTGSPDITLADPSKGYVAGNTLNVSLPVTTTLVHKDPDPENGLYIYPYLWLFSPDNLRSATFNYSLTRPQAATISVSRNQINSQWQNVVEDHKLVLTPMYRGILPSGMIAMTPPYSPTAGLNQRVSFFFNMGYAVPAYECFGLPMPPFYVTIVPICYTRDSTGNSSKQVDSLLFDIFPASLDGFMTLGSKADNGRGLAWDSAFPSLVDADGDGLLADIHNGLDPNDTTVDTDNDKLTDKFELEQRALGQAYATGLKDTDSDGLSDWQEASLGLDPAVADTDNDGLLDGEEVRHQVVDSNGNLTNQWAGGWQVRINATTPFNVNVSSDPFLADSDNDGLSDQAERQLALSTCSAAEVSAGNCEGNPPKPKDKQNRPYHPMVANTPPLALMVSTSDFDGVVGPNQSIRYTTTVVANTAVAPGVLNVTAPAVLGGAPNPAALPFNTLTFSGSQTVTVASNFTVASTATTQEIGITSTATTRLPNSGAAGWSWEAVTSEALAPVAAPYTLRDSAVAPSRPDRQDTYLFAGQSVNNIVVSDGLGHQPGDLFAYSVPSGATRQLDQDTDALNTDYTPAEINGAFLRGLTNPSVACNNSGACLVAWEHLDYCNTLSIDSLKVVAEGNDGVAGVEPIIYLVRDPNDTEPRNGGYHDVWIPPDNSYQDIRTGQTRGPNANGFPVVLPFCGPTRLYMSELDGNEKPVPDPTQTDWDGMAFLGSHLLSPTADRVVTKTLDYIGGDGYHIQLNIRVLHPPSGRQRVIAAALLAPDGSISKPQFQLSLNTATTLRDDFSPAVASDGTNFLVAWEDLLQPNSSWLYYRIVEANGNATGNVVGVDSVTLNNLSVVQPYADLTASWSGSNYLITRQMRPLNGVTINSPNDITVRAIDPGGTYVVGSTTTLVSDAANDRFDNHHLAWDAARGASLLVYRATDGKIKGKVSGNVNAGPVELAPTGSRPQAAYHPTSQSWLVSYEDGSRVQFRNFTTDLSGALVSGTQPQFPSPLATNSLACPVSDSVATVDLRFEELPGVTTFVDSSGRGNNATCTGASCPSAGVAGAPNAPLSDYAAKFDGTDDALTVNRAFAGSFSVMYWIKAANGATNNALVVDQGANVANGWTFYLGNGQPSLLIGTNQNINAPSRIDDGTWHFVAATRNQSTGAIAIYLDGNPTPAVSGTATTGALSAVNNILIGGDRSGNRDLNATIDHLQIYPVALGGDVVQSIYNRQQQSYCVGGGVDGAAKDKINWTRLKLTQQDTRGGRLMASSSLNLIIDNNAPTAAVSSVQNGEVIGPDQVIGGTASDPTSGITRVEVRINNGAWLPATGANTWSFSLAGYTGNLAVSVRATDQAGNVGAASTAVNLTIDTTAPQVTITAPTTTVKPTQANGQWQVTISGGVTDNVTNHILANSVRVRLEQQSGIGALQSEQTATQSGNSWSINYLLEPGLFDPTGAYTVTVQAEDQLGNRSNPATGVVRLDTTGPVATLSSTDVARQVISQTVTISGLITDVNSLIGLDKVEIAFTPVEQIAALPANITTAEAETRLNRTWTQANLAQRGTGVAKTTWSFAIPTGLENLYQIDVRGYDLLGNVSLNANLWRGMIDTRDPRIVMTATATGATYVNTADNTQRYEVRFVCATQDRNLNESSFVCPGEGLAEPVRSFDNNAALQALFPDLTLRTGLAISYTLWTTTTTPVATASACDGFGRCAQASTSAVAGVAAGGVVQGASLQAAAPGTPLAVIINPTKNSFVAAGNAMSVTVAAEAGAGLKDVTIKLDNATVQTLSFAQSPAITRTLRTVNVPVATEGLHTLAVQATAWDNSSQATPFAVAFTLDQNVPNLTIDASTLTLADTWQAQSGILRFNGNASDSVGLAAVQVREGANPFADATFGNGTWQIALPVADPEGRTVNITVRAIDRAGRITQLTQAIATDLSAADAPDTRLISGPANPSVTNSASFVFTSTVSVFECSLDNGVYTPCASPTNYSDLSKGSHTFLVRAIDGRGLPDLSPATYTWTVNAGQPDATITGKPVNPTTDRTATFTFSGDATATRFECALDGSAYASCTSPKVYTNLGNGAHTFQVRARNSANVAGAADRYVWTITNLTPVANSQTVVVVPNVAKRITLTAIDNEPLVYTILTPPTHGVLTGLPPNVTYSPDTGYGGPDSFTFKASDGLAESNVAVVTLFVDNVPPVVTCSVTPNNLWPPNHKLINIQAAVTVSDLHSGPAGFTLVSVTSSEADSGLDAADVPLDIQNWVAGTPDLVGQLRAERSDAGNGRTYTLTYEGKDLANNKARCTTTVTVPKNQGGGGKATYDENLVLPDAYVDAQPAPADPVITPTEETPNSDAGVVNPEALPLRLFLPLISNDTVIEQQ